MKPWITFIFNFFLFSIGFSQTYSIELGLFELHTPLNNIRLNHSAESPISIAKSRFKSEGFKALDLYTLGSFLPFHYLNGKWPYPSSFQIRRSFKNKSGCLVGYDNIGTVNEGLNNKYKPLDIGDFVMSNSFLLYTGYTKYFDTKRKLKPSIDFNLVYGNTQEVQIIGFGSVLGFKNGYPIYEYLVQNRTGQKFGYGLTGKLDYPLNKWLNLSCSMNTFHFVYSELKNRSKILLKGNFWIGVKF